MATPLALPCSSHLLRNPAIGLTKICKLLLKHPDKPDKWQAPGVPDATAGEWPSEVTAKLVEMVGGFDVHDEEDRMSLTDALKELESIVESRRAHRASLPEGR